MTRLEDSVRSCSHLQLAAPVLLSSSHLQQLSYPALTWPRACSQYAGTISVSATSESDSEGFQPRAFQSPVEGPLPAQFPIRKAERSRSGSGVCVCGCVCGLGLGLGLGEEEEEEEEERYYSYSRPYCGSRLF